MSFYTITPKTSFFLSLILIVFAITSSNDPKDKEGCAEPLVGLATCLAYVGGTAKAPTPDCCSGLKQVLKTHKKCLCVVIIKDRNVNPDSGLNVNATLALGLPGVCNAPANVSECPALLDLPPNSADARIFYQIGLKSNNTTAASPVAGGPIASVAPGPSSTSAAPFRARGGMPTRTFGAGSSRPYNSGGCVKGKRGFGLEIMCMILVLLSILIIF